MARGFMRRMDGPTFQVMVFLTRTEAVVQWPSGERWVFPPDLWQTVHTVEAVNARAEVVIVQNLRPDAGVRVVAGDVGE